MQTSKPPKKASGAGAEKDPVVAAGTPPEAFAGDDVEDDPWMPKTEPVQAPGPDANTGAEAVADAIYQGPQEGAPDQEPNLKFTANPDMLPTVGDLNLGMVTVSITTPADQQRAGFFHPQADVILRHRMGYLRPKKKGANP